MLTKSIQRVVGTASDNLGSTGHDPCKPGFALVGEEFPLPYAPGTPRTCPVPRAGRHRSAVLTLSFAQPGSSKPTYNI